MVLVGPELTEVLGRSSDQIELRNEYGRHCRTLTRAEAMGLDTEMFVGVGNRRRVRFMKPREYKTAINAGSRTTHRMNDGAGKFIAPPIIREHRPIPGGR